VNRIVIVIELFIAACSFVVCALAVTIERQLVERNAPLLRDHAEMQLRLEGSEGLPYLGDLDTPGAYAAGNGRKAP
jgi:hypothetical protein